jgi:short-subunit dehydrogenase
MPRLESVGVGGLFSKPILDAELNVVELLCRDRQTGKVGSPAVRELNAGQDSFTASIAGEMVALREPVYAATKAFVLSFTQ